MNAAIAQQIITFNPASHIELPAGTAPKPLIWTDERVQRWQKTGLRPSSVMVWAPEQTGRFLDHAPGDPLYPLFQLIAYRGLRKVVQETLGHARYTTTANIYTSVLPSLAYRAAEATARFVPRQPLPAAS